MFLFYLLFLQHGEHIMYMKFTHPNYEQGYQIWVSLSFTGKSSTSRSLTKNWIIPIWKFGAKSIVNVRLWDFCCHSKTAYPDIKHYFLLPDQHPRVILTLKEKKSPITHLTADLQSKNQPVIWTLKPRLPWG